MVKREDVPRYKSEAEVLVFPEQRGQATVEAVFVLPVLFLMMLLLIQPAIVLYDRIVMEAAAAEGCRLLATKTTADGNMTESCEAFIRHRLSAVPSQDNFHVHRDECSWEIKFEGDERSKKVSVTISNKISPLPLFDAGAALLGMLDADGLWPLEVSASLQTQPDWVDDAEVGRDPAAWIGAWL